MTIDSLALPNSTIQDGGLDLPTTQQPQDLPSFLSFFASFTELDESENSKTTSAPLPNAGPQRIPTTFSGIAQFEEALNEASEEQLRTEQSSIGEDDTLNPGSTISHEAEQQHGPLLQTVDLVETIPLDISVNQVAPLLTSLGQSEMVAKADRVHEPRERKTIPPRLSIVGERALAQDASNDSSLLASDALGAIRTTPQDSKKASTNEPVAFDIQVDRPESSPFDQGMDSPQLAPAAQTETSDRSQRLPLSLVTREEAAADQSTQDRQSKVKPDQVATGRDSNSRLADAGETHKIAAVSEPVQRQSSNDHESAPRVAPELTPTHGQRGTEPQPSSVVAERTSTSGEHRTAYIEQLRFDSERKLAEAPLRTFRISLESPTESVDLSLMTRNRGIQIVARANDPQLNFALQRDLPELSSSLGRSGYEMKISLDQGTANHPVTSAPASPSSNLQNGTGGSPQGNKQKGRRNTPDANPSGRRRGTS